MPWESDHTTLSMAVTSTQGEGWALEHTDMGTVRLTDLGNETTRVEILSTSRITPEKSEAGQTLRPIQQ